MISEFAKRRNLVLQKMKDNSALLLFSGVGKKSSADENYPFCVNKNFYYLTGIEQENSAILFIKNKGDEKVYLFIESKNELKEKWTGIRLSFEEATSISGISNILLITSLEAKIDAIFDEKFGEYSDVNSLYLDLEKENKIGDCLSVEFYRDNLVKKYPNIEIIDCYNDIIKLRTIKSPYEVDRIREAIAITKKGIEKVFAAAKDDMYEYNFRNIFEFSIRQDQSRTAFSTIVASGHNGVILHYPNATSKVENGDLVLLDLGATKENYCADISRTFPLNGKFGDLQKKIYKIVLECNKNTIGFARPGITLLELNNFAKEFLTSECIEQGLIKSKEDIVNVYYHSVSHHLGLDTHDPDGENRKGLLVPGNVITVEPGLYFKEYGIGIRIEDDVLITETGSENLSKDIIKEVEDIETFMKLNKDY